MSNIQNQFINSVNLNADTSFPYLVLDVVGENSYPKNPGFQVMHWHEDLQFIYVIEGIIEIRTLDSTFSVSSGSGTFINKGVIHLIRKNNACHYNSFIFPDYFLKFYLGSPAKDFVENIVGKENLPVYVFSKENNSCTSVLSKLRSLSDLEKNKNEFYIYEVLVLLSNLWLEVIKNIQFPTIKSNTVLNLRMQKFLRYIEQNYSSNFSLDELADSANVSKSECLRCFKASLQITPYKYLTEFRLAKAAELLKNTDYPISKVADLTGFCQLSHFGKCFKEKTGYTPKEYRKQKA